MSNRYDFMSVPVYALGNGVVGDIKRITFGFGRRYLVVLDSHATDNLCECIEAGFRRPISEQFASGDNKLGRAPGLVDDLDLDDIRDEEIRCQFLRHVCHACTKAEAQTLSREILSTNSDVVVAAGGARCLDLVRAAMHYCGSYERPRLVLLPTVVTTNACINGSSIMYDADGRVCDFWNLAMPPEAVIVDTGLIAKAPARFLAAAIGDQIASSMESLHTLKYLESGDFDPFAAAHHRAVLDVIERYAEEALASVEKGGVNSSLEFICHAVTRYTGPQQATSVSFFSHVLDEALIAYPEVKNHMHGEVVAYGVLPELVAMGEVHELERWVHLFGKTGLPRTLGELGIPWATQSDIEAACGESANMIMAAGALVHWTPGEMAEAVMTSDRIVEEILH